MALRCAYLQTLDKIVNVCSKGLKVHMSITAKEWQVTVGAD